MIGIPLLLGLAFAQQKVIFDCDIADDIDDAYALGLLVQIPDLKILGVSTSFGNTHGRAKVAAKLLRAFDRPDISVYAGRPSNVPIRGQFAWVKDFDSNSVKAETAVEFMHREVERSPNQVTIIAVGPLTNVGDLINQYPESKSKIKRVVIMGGSFYVGYNNQPPVSPEWNIACDPSAARTLINSGISVILAGLDVTTMMQFDDDMLRKLTNYGTTGTTAIAELKTLWGYGNPTLFDPGAVAYGTGFKFAKEQQVHLEVDEKGFTRVTKGSPTVTILVEPQKKEFLDWYIAMYQSKNSILFRDAVALRSKN
jgi:hypothetical protein